MSQSNVIAGALAIAFIIFITVRGKLTAYIELFTATAPKDGEVTSEDDGGIFGGSFSDFLGGDIEDALKGYAKDTAKDWLSDVVAKNSKNAFVSNPTSEI